MTLAINPCSALYVKVVRCVFPCCCCICFLAQFDLKTAFIRNTYENTYEVKILTLDTFQSVSNKCGHISDNSVAHLGLPPERENLQPRPDCWSKCSKLTTQVASENKKIKKMGSFHKRLQVMQQLKMSQNLRILTRSASTGGQKVRIFKIQILIENLKSVDFL